MLGLPIVLQCEQREGSYTAQNIIQRSIHSTYEVPCNLVILQRTSGTCLFGLLGTLLSTTEQIDTY
jgi:hypothetical protein